MTNARIDTIARSLARELPRRRVLGGLAAGLAAATGLVTLPESALACKKVGKTCDKNQDCCAGAKCKGGKCTCKNGRDECGGKCYDLDRDEKRCGDCNNACDSGQICAGGTCVTGRGTCPSGADYCAGDETAKDCYGDPSCFCFRTTEATTRCGKVATDQCGSCQRSADCAEFGLGAFCATDTGPNCACDNPGDGFCAVPCPSQPPRTTRAPG